MDNARFAAVKGLCRVFDKGGYSNIVLDSILPQTEDRSFCAAMFYGVIERAVTLDHIISKYCRMPIKKLSPEVKEILRLGVYQLKYMPSVGQHAAVNETVALAAAFRQRSAGSLVNAILRAFIRDGLTVPPCRDRLEALSVEYSVPGELISFWERDYGRDTALRILEGTRSPAPVYVRVNTLRTTPPELIGRLAEEQFAAAEVEGVPGALRISGSGELTALPSFREGLFHVQDISSQLCARSLDPRPGMRVADFCAAPGGKSFTAAQLMEGRGELLAMDLYDSRLSLVKEGAERLGLDCISVRANDAAVYSGELGLFDRILCDVVCSGLGVIRRKPEIRYKSLSGIDGLPEIQYNILNTASRSLKEGGRLVYSTCTLNPAENQRVAEKFLEAHPDFSPAGEMRTYIASPELDCDGFFTAVFIKGGGEL